MGDMRLVDAEALKEKAIRVSTVKEHTYLKAVGTHEIDKAPTVDAVPVVRCKDCKFFKYDDYCSEDKMEHSHARENDFCSYGERKGGDS